jgi:hypothetical protein
LTCPQHFDFALPHPKYGFRLDALFLWSVLLHIGMIVCLFIF